MLWKMEKHVRFGLLATSVLHMLFAGIWWVSSAHFQPLPSALPEEHVMKVQLQTNQEDTRTDSKEITSEVALADASSPADTSNEHAVELSDAAVSPTSPLILPPQDTPYVPAGELDVRPRPEAPVIVPFPDGTLQKNKVTGVLVLYVGATGQVDRVEVDESDLPPFLEKAAVETFLQARMHPGVKDGKATRARMKILVEFEAQ